MTGSLLVQLVDFPDCPEGISLARVEEEFPIAYRQLLWLADGTLAGVTQMRKTDGTALGAYMVALIMMFRDEFERIKGLVNLYRETAPVCTALGTISRYQSALDYELYEALRALCEAQNWRARRVDTEPKRVYDLESAT